MGMLLSLAIIQKTVNIMRHPTHCVAYFSLHTVFTVHCWNLKWNLCVWPFKLCVILYKMVLSFKSVDETLVCDHFNESYWAVLSCGIVFLSCTRNFYLFESMDETVVCDHSNESYWRTFVRYCLLYAKQAGVILISWCTLLVNMKP